MEGVKSGPEGLESDYVGMLGKSQIMRGIFATIDSIKNSATTILIQGESGTGKEMVAKAIHQTSQRSAQPFWVINCAAIPEALLESELFGHVKGSFTGAIQDKPGLFEQANGGTLFLDEIGEVSTTFQVKLLRVLQDGEYKRIGEGQARHADVRIIAATNQDLAAAVKAGTFREDLYYRLNVIAIHLPPLRERSEDIAPLARHFLEKYNRKLKKQLSGLTPEALKALQSYAWIGNIRELENVIERCVVLSPGPLLRLQDLPAVVLQPQVRADELDLGRYSYRDAKHKALFNFHKFYLRQLLAQSGGNVSLASLKAGMDRSNFKKIIKKYQIDLQDFRRGDL